MHVRSNGQVLVTGSLAETWSLDPSGAGTWTDLGIQRANGQRDYAPSVLYGADQVLYIGGGSPPIADAELLDLSQQPPAWRDPKDQAAQMAFPRRQHNATILPDGTVLVTGGTRSGGAGPPENFNNLDPGQPIHVAELWDPGTGHWTQLAAEQEDRCYHSTAVLLPDGRVLSAGGGDFFPVEGVPEENAPAGQPPGRADLLPALPVQGRPAGDHVRAGHGQLRRDVPGRDRSAGRHPEGDLDRPVVGHALVQHGPAVPRAAGRAVGQRPGGDGARVAGRLPAGPLPDVSRDDRGSSVGRGDRAGGGGSRVSLSRRRPARSGAASGGGGRGATPRWPLAEARPSAQPAAAPATPAPPDVFALRASVLAAATGTKVVIGITGTCPYGIAACWGGANEALHHLDGVAFVDPIANAEDSTATVFLAGDGLPPLDRWREEFRRIANDSYTLRGFEVTVSGRVTTRDGTVILVSDGAVPPLVLMPLDQADVVQWDRSARAPRAADPRELDAYLRTRPADRRPHRPARSGSPAGNGDGAARTGDVRIPAAGADRRRAGPVAYRRAAAPS